VKAYEVTTLKKCVEEESANAKDEEGHPEK